MSARPAHTAAPTPTTPPNAASSTLSASICRMISPAAGAERDANADFLEPAGRAREQQTSDVRAAHEQHESDSPHEQRDEAERRPAYLRRDARLALGEQRDAAALLGDVRPVARIRRGELTRHDAHARLRLFDRDAGLEPSVHERAAIAA